MIVMSESKQVLKKKTFEGKLDVTLDGTYELGEWATLKGYDGDDGDGNLLDLLREIVGQGEWVRGDYVDPLKNLDGKKVRITIELLE